MFAASLLWSNAVIGPPASALEAHLHFASICTPSSPVGPHRPLSFSVARCSSQRRAEQTDSTSGPTGSHVKELRPVCLIDPINREHATQKRRNYASNLPTSFHICICCQCIRPAFSCTAATPRSAERNRPRSCNARTGVPLSIEYLQYLYIARQFLCRIYGHKPHPRSGRLHCQKEHNRMARLLWVCEPGQQHFCFLQYQFHARFDIEDIRGNCPDAAP